MAYENEDRKYRRFSEEEIAEARRTEMVGVANALGYHTRRVGKCYELEEHDSLRIFPNNTYCRFANVIDGKPETGSVIDFAMRYGGMEFREAVTWLLNYGGRDYGSGRIGSAPVPGERVTTVATEKNLDRSTTQMVNPDVGDGNSEMEEKATGFFSVREQAGSKARQTVGQSDSQLDNKPDNQSDNQQERPEFCLPEPNDNNRRMYAYLCKTRCIPSNIVHEMWKLGLIYESKSHHNIVFVSRDRDGEAKHAFMRGTSSMFKCDVPGSDKLHYCFVIPASGARTDTVCVYEGAIDAMSAKALDYLDRKIGNGEPWRIALGMLSDSPLEYFLTEHPEIRNICFCMDRDFRGRKAVLGTAEKEGEPGKEGLLEKWKKAGYQVTDCPPKLEKEQGKDYNDLLILRMKTTQEENHTHEEHRWERTTESPFTAEKNQILQRGQMGESLNRYGQVVSVNGERERVTNGGKNRDRGRGRNGQTQKYRNRPQVSHGYGYQQPRLRR